MNMMLRQNLEIRQTLIQKLGLESEYLRSVLVRSEMILKTSDGQRGLKLIRRFEEENRYRSVLDFLCGLFAPSLKPHIFGYYQGETGRFIEEFPWVDMDTVDRAMVLTLNELSRLSIELRHQRLHRKVRDELIEAELDLFLRPLFPVFPSLEIQAAA